MKNVLAKTLAKLLGNKSQVTAKLFSSSQNKDGLILDLYGTVGDYWEYNEAVDLLNILRNNPKAAHIELNVHSLGGYILEGLAIMNLLKDHSATVTATVQGTAASMASLIIMAADHVRVHENSWIMIHEASITTAGGVSDLERDATWLQNQNELAAKTYANKTGINIEDIKKMMAEETWMNGAQAVELGFADELIPFATAQESISPQMKALTAQPLMFATLDVYKNVPLNCLPTDKTAVLKSKITKMEIPMAKPTEKEITAAHAVLEAAKAADKNIIDNKTVDVTKPVQIADATQVAQLCALAGKPEKIAAFLLAGKNPDQVRAELAGEKSNELAALPDVDIQLSADLNKPTGPSLSEMAKQSCVKQGLIK